MKSITSSFEAYPAKHNILKYVDLTYKNLPQSEPAPSPMAPQCLPQAAARAGLGRQDSQVPQTAEPWHSFHMCLRSLTIRALKLSFVIK